MLIKSDTNKMVTSYCLIVFVVTSVTVISTYEHPGEISLSEMPYDKSNIHNVNYSAISGRWESPENGSLDAWIFTRYNPAVCYANWNGSVIAHTCTCGKFDTLLSKKYAFYVRTNATGKLKVTNDLKTLYYHKKSVIKIHLEKAKVGSHVALECYRAIFCQLTTLFLKDFAKRKPLRATSRGSLDIGDSVFTELMIPPKSPGRQVSLIKHSLASSTKTQRGQNKQPEIDTSGQIHTNLLNESGDMSTPWRTANRKQLVRDCPPVSNNSSGRILRTDLAKVHLLNKKAASLTQYSSYFKNKRSEFGFVDYNNMIHREARIPAGLQCRKTERDLQHNLIKGIYFSQQIEDMCKVAFFNSESSDWWRAWKIRDVYEMQTTGCGSGQNRLLVFEDGTKACARYRPNIDQIQGEIFSYYLSRLLGLRNVPRPIVTKIDTDTRHWSRVRDFVASAQWATQTPFVLTPWIENLTETHIPSEFLGSKGKLFQGMFSRNNKSIHYLCQILQWTDLIIFDFLTGHLDRIVNMMHNSKWSPRIFTKPVHNLLASKTSANLIFLDNESGLIHGYRALGTFAPHHERSLKSVCIFRRRTVTAIARLDKGRNVGDELRDLFFAEDVNHNLIPNLPADVTSTLQHRISLVHRHIRTCEATRII